MTKSFKLYSVIFFIGLCFAAWSAYQWKDTVDNRFNLAESHPKKYTPVPEKKTDAHSYHRPGRFAAIRVFHGEANIRSQPQPLFWAKGNLLVISKVHWQKPDLAYECSKISRTTLHQMIDDVELLPKRAKADDDLVLTRTLGDGSKAIYYLPQAQLKKFLGTWLKPKPWKPYVLQALTIFGIKKEDDATYPPWPFRRLSMKKILSESPMVVGKRETVRRVQELYRQPQFYRQGKLCGFFSILARVDR